MARGRRFPSPSRVVKLLTYGPEPVGKAAQAFLRNYTLNQLSGHGPDGIPHYGMRGDAALTFSGWVASPQQFQGNAQMGASHNTSVQRYPALPADQAPNNLPQWLNDYEALQAGSS
jgi:hypothetical protein